jgi:hypothetical protein
MPSIVVWTLSQLSRKWLIAGTGRRRASSPVVRYAPADIVCMLLKPGRAEIGCRAWPQVFDLNLFPPGDPGLVRGDKPVLKTGTFPGALQPLRF